MANKIKIQLASSETCTGCSACANICPKACISMVEDREGFVQPKIDTKACIQCHKCEKTCPIINKETINNNFETKAYAAINPNEEIRLQSSSGGVFYTLAKWVIDQGGVVFGARWNEKWEVIHGYAEDLDGVKAFMKSKYVQSRIGETYKQVKNFLNQDRWVLYSGTPCQLGGLRAYLGKEYEKLLQVDLICHGVPSPGVWRKYLKDYVGKDTILDINMRDKSEGWESFQFFTTTTTTTTRCEHQMSNPFFKGFLYNVYLRKSCYNCLFRTYHRLSDITIADYWGVNELCPNMFDDKGTSIMFVHSEKGNFLLNNILKHLIIQIQSKENATKYNPGIEQNEENHKSLIVRKHFFITYRFIPFHISKYFISKEDVYYRLVRKIKKIFHIYAK